MVQIKVVNVQVFILTLYSKAHLAYIQVLHKAELYKKECFTRVGHVADEV